MPDIDMDFGDTRRGEVVEYVRRQVRRRSCGAGRDLRHLMAARGVIRDVGRALNMSYADCDVIAKLVPAGPHVTLDDALRISRELREKYEGDEQVKKLIDTARALKACRATPRRTPPAWLSRSARSSTMSRSRATTTRSSAVRDDDARRARPAQNGLPWPAQPHDSG